MIQDSSDHSSSKRARHSASSGREENSLVDIDTFHTFLTVETFTCVKMLGTYLEDNFSDIFGTKYDIVSFLYSVVLTKGPDNVAAERQDLEESLIGQYRLKSVVSTINKKNFHCLDPVHGHGSQSLINLMVTGVATQNVFDGDKDLCGLQLRGISAQSDVGFLSYLECLR